jgi:ribonuclease HI
MRDFTLHFDGSCWPNPGGTAAYGTILEQTGQAEINAEAGVIGTSPQMSNNVAEFYALGVGLQRFIEFGPLEGDVVHVYGDSNIVIQMMQGKFRANASKLYYPEYLRTFGLLSILEDEYKVTVDFTWISRDKNTRCDDLSKEHNHAPK